MRDETFLRLIIAGLVACVLIVIGGAALLIHIGQPESAATLVLGAVIGYALPLITVAANR